MGVEDHKMQRNKICCLLFVSCDCLLMVKRVPKIYNPMIDFLWKFWYFITKKVSSRKYSSNPQIFYQQGRFAVELTGVKSNEVKI